MDLTIISTLTALRNALVDERRRVASEWMRDRGDPCDCATEIKRIEDLIEVVDHAMRDERVNQAGGARARG